MPSPPPFDDATPPRRRVPRHWALVAQLLALLLVSACGPKPHPQAQPTAPEALHQGPLADYIQAASLRWLLLAKPKQIASQPTLKDALALLLPRPRLDLFAQESGVDLRRLRAGAIANYPLGPLYLSRLSGNGVRVEKAFLQRLLSGKRSRHPVPNLRAHTGIIGNTPQTLLIAEDRFSAIAVGDPTLANTAELFARRRLKRASPISRTEDFRAFARDFSEADCAFFAPGPFTGEWVAGAGGLLGAATAVVASLRVEGTQLRLTIAMSGDWDPAADIPTLERSWEALRASSLGHLLALRHPAVPAEVNSSRERLELTVLLHPNAMAQGLRAAVAADVWEIMKSSNWDKSTDISHPTKPL